jgi:hypothetical protein
LTMRWRKAAGAAAFSSEVVQTVAYVVLGGVLLRKGEQRVEVGPKREDKDGWS